MIVSVFIALFLYIFQPFGFVNFTGNKILLSIAFGIATSIGQLISIYIIKGYFLRRWVKKWLFIYEVISISSLLLIISFLNWLCFYLFVFPVVFDATIVAYVFGITFCVGLIPVLVLNMIEKNQQLKRELQYHINPSVIEVNKDSYAGRSITFISLNKKDKPLVIDVNSLIYLEALKNNVKVVYFDNEEVKQKWIRNTLSSTLMLFHENHIVQCHRSFVVNLHHIVSAKGNTNGYQLISKASSDPIPVSRKYAADFQKVLH
ncbi:LytTR family transcriptional regulator DNA-binding domain-containing protein [Halosquirtibacter xylanolyticus]|uniref:LytR/AlgR family response regulator transcription factor n=1 Tax=Halosquirtibacter xylanolyticus TaxID=3374599 RepID=UPI003749AFEA|nr:LytTR family transcriptional regulator DNA-binding domain-containing protein [Prolixibacteraceae bacterium]